MLSLGSVRKEGVFLAPFLSNAARPQLLDRILCKECCAKSCSRCIRVHLKDFFENAVPISNNSTNFVCVNFLKTRFSGCLACKFNAVLKTKHDQLMEGAIAGIKQF